MRTPGNDFELAAGFVSTRASFARANEIVGITYCVDPKIDAEQRYNIVNVELRRLDAARLDALERHFTMTSACGVCGKANLEALADAWSRAAARRRPRADRDALYALPERMRDAQRVFATTGGLHAAALFDARGNDAGGA